MTIKQLSATKLGKPTHYTFTYQPELLQPLARSMGRDMLKINSMALPFQGIDIWNAYELSWLDRHGKPQIAIAELAVPCQSSHLIESKSLKLYLNSFTMTKFSTAAMVQKTIKKDLSQAVGATVAVTLIMPKHFAALKIKSFIGNCLDGLKIASGEYHPDPALLRVKKTIVHERLYSNLLKSNCPVTGQPDWASVWIHYHGPQISHSHLLKYIISSRSHEEFHEQCVERLFVDIMRYCQPKKLTVYARYTRRGGLDINPFRSNFEKAPYNIRLARQ